MNKEQKLLIEKAEKMEEDAIKLTMNLKKSFKHTGKLQAQDVARIEQLYKQADSLKKTAEMI